MQQSKYADCNMFGNVPHGLIYLSNLTPLTDVCVFSHLFQGPLSGPEYGPTLSPPLTKYVIGGRFSMPFFGPKGGTALDHYFFTRKSVFLDD